MIRPKWVAAKAKCHCLARDGAGQVYGMLAACAENFFRFFKAFRLAIAARAVFVPERALIAISFAFSTAPWHTQRFEKSLRLLCAGLEAHSISFSIAIVREYRYVVYI